MIFTRTIVGVQGAVITKEYKRNQWATSVLDPLHRLPASYVPRNLTWITPQALPSAKGVFQLRRDTAESLRAMLLAGDVAGAQSVLDALPAEMAADPAIAQGLYPPGSIIVARYRSVLRQETQILFSATQKAVYQSMLPTHVLSNLFGVLREGVGLADRATFVVDPDGVIQIMEITCEGVGRNANELTRKIKAAQYVRANPGQVCPAAWEEGGDTLAPSLDLVGKI